MTQWRKHEEPEQRRMVTVRQTTWPVAVREGGGSQSSRSSNEESPNRRGGEEEKVKSARKGSNLFFLTPTFPYGVRIILPIIMTHNSMHFKEERSEWCVGCLKSPQLTLLHLIHLPSPVASCHCIRKEDSCCRKAPLTP